LAGKSILTTSSLGGAGFEVAPNVSQILILSHTLRLRRHSRVCRRLAAWSASTLKLGVFWLDRLEGKLQGGQTASLLYDICKFKLESKKALHLCLASLFSRNGGLCWHSANWLNWVT
jgi:hypothetical protein